VCVEHSDEEAMSPRGFSLIELLLACALLVLIGGVVAALAGPLRLALERSDGSAQLEPAGTAALEALVADVREAGSGAAVADPRWRLARGVTRVLSMRDLDTDSLEIPGGAIRVARTPRRGAQAVLSTPALAGDTLLHLDLTSRCSGGAPSCGFSDGTVAVLYDADAADVVTISSAAPGPVVLSRPVTSAFAAGAALSELVTTTYGTRRAMGGSRQLVSLTTGGAEQPVLDNVVDFEVTPDSADVTRMSQVRIRVRIEAPAAALRGPAGYFFRRAGTAGDGRRWLPDVELRFTIALRNPAGDL
jgi:Tfp pilus assembly protein PilW